MVLHQSWYYDNHGITTIMVLRQSWHYVNLFYHGIMSIMVLHQSWYCINHGITSIMVLRQSWYYVSHGITSVMVLRQTPTVMPVTVITGITIASHYIIMSLQVRTTNSSRQNWSSQQNRTRHNPGKQLTRQPTKETAMQDGIALGSRMEVAHVYNLWESKKQ